MYPESVTIADTATLHNEFTCFVTDSPSWVNHYPAMVLNMWEGLSSRLDAHLDNVLYQQNNLPADVYSTLIRTLTRCVESRRRVSHCFEYSSVLNLTDTDELSLADVLLERAAKTTEQTVTPL